jgi:hypothetical protein
MTTDEIMDLADAYAIDRASTAFALHHTGENPLANELLKTLNYEKRRGALLAAVEELVKSERERICKAIKEEDDYCVTQGEYMLDSDDCIAVAKGTWVRPEFAIDSDMEGQA